MGATQLTTRQLGSASITRDDLDTTTTTKAIIAKILAGSGITASSTGIDAGTGDVTVNNYLSGYTTTATAAGTTTLTSSSTYQQYFTGSTTQTVLLPVTSTLALGWSFYIVNNSLGVVTVQSSGTNTLVTMQPSTRALVTCILTSGTSAASWNYFYNTLLGSIDPITSGRVVVSTIGGWPAQASNTTTTQVNYLSSATGTTGTASTNLVFSTSPTLVTPLLGTPTSGTLTNCTGLPEGGLSLTDITTANTSTSAHGFFPKLTSNSIYYVSNAGALTPLTVGASGTVLTGNGTTSAPTWTAPAAASGLFELIIDSSASNAAAITIDFSSYSAYKNFKFEFYHLYPATNGANIGIQVSADGTTFDATSGNYSWTQQYAISNTNSGGNGGTTGTMGSALFAVESTQANAAELSFMLRDPFSTSYKTRIIFEAIFTDRWGSGEIQYTGSITRTTAQACKGIKVLCDSGNIYGTYRVWAAK